MTTKRTPRRKGRPPAGKRPGERSSEYPRFALRLPEQAHNRLLTLAELSNRPQWRILSDAVDSYIRQLPDDQRALVHRLLERADTILSKPIRAAAEPPTGITILNVDDNDAMRFVRSAMLRQEGYQVVEAATGQGALRALETCDARVVVLDVNLPDMSGIDVCRQIKSDSRWRHVRIVQTSATFSSPHDQLQGLESGGADIYLAEPVPRGTLLSIIRRLVTEVPA